MLDLNEGRSSEVRKSQDGDVLDGSKCSETHNCSGSFNQVISRVHGLLIMQLN